MSSVTTSSSATSDGDNGKAAGAFLREAREAQALAVADVARQLKLSTTQVEALEAGEFRRLPGPVFVRGFVRNYARLLKLDVEPLLQAVASNLPREDPLPAPPSVEVPFPTAAPRRWHLYAGAVAAIVAALAAYEFFPTASEPAVTESTTAAPAAAPASSVQADSLSAALADPGTARSPGPPSDRREVAGAARTGIEAPAPPVQPGLRSATGVGDSLQGTTQLAIGTPAAPDPAPAAAKSPVREEEAAPGPVERQVHMVFDQASWVEIRDRSGKAIFSQLNAPGTEQRISGRPPLAVVVGNAHGVRLTYDEQPVNLSLHTKVDVARLTLQ